MPQKLLRRADVEARTGLSRSTIYAWMEKGSFPKPMKLGARLVAWRETDIDAWVEGKSEAGEVQP